MNNLTKTSSVSILKIQKNNKHFVGKKLLISGWVRSLRNSKNKTFFVLNDGSCLGNLQVVFSGDYLQKISHEKLANFGSFVTVEGVLVETPDREDKFELRGEGLVHLSSAQNSYPLQRKEMSLSFLRDNLHIRSKTTFFLAVFKVRSELRKIIGDFFWKENFFYVNTPIITTNDAEGGGESFKIRDSEPESFFGRAANLSVSGQLHEESLTQGMGKVYNFSPCFRAEKSDTSKHLSEFWMVEAEMFSCKIKQLIRTIEKLIKYTFKTIVKRCQEELFFLERHQSKVIVKELEALCKKKIPVATYQECLDLVKLKSRKEKQFFEFSNIEWGIDFKSEHEKYLCDYFNSPLFITDYPTETKAFYAKVNKDEKTVAAVDLIFPQVGEIAGGSVREDSIKSMERRVNSEKVREELDWYFRIREYGYSGSAGFGMGFERLVMAITKCENIRDVIHFYRSSKDLKF